jgi:NADH-quinone oxidoreductase subunit L
MNSPIILLLFVLLPFAGFIISLFFHDKEEYILSRISAFTVAISLLLFIGYTVSWALEGFPQRYYEGPCLFQMGGYRFSIDFYFGPIAATFFVVGALLTLLISIYSQYYLHREKGYKRFFCTLLFFYFGYNITILAGNLEILFMGWEVLGICSFLLIAFYRDRYLPVRNALKVFTVYRIGDVGLVLAMWMCELLWHHSITFRELDNDSHLISELESHSLSGTFIALMLLVTAAAKSAQLPFSSWLPRAMEGPTPSSAIFYGSLSVHLGAFILLRTHELWEHQYVVRWIIGILGLFSSIITALIARVQSSIKSQIAYSSSAQIGLIFIEIAVGFHTLALIHFAGNAFLRTYQLLVSPSVASYLIREQFYNYVPRKVTIEDTWPRKFEYTIYMLSLKEWNLDVFMSRFLWNPLKNLGRKLNFFSLKSLLYFFIPAYLIGLIILYSRAHLPEGISVYIPVIFALIGLGMVLKALSEKQNVLMAWTMIIMNHFWVALAVSFNETFLYSQVHIYLSGIIVAGLIGYLCLYRLKNYERQCDLSQFHGHVYEHPRLSVIFLLACLGLTGFPITPTFIGEDLIFSHIHKDQYLLAIIVSSGFVIDGLALARIFARIFLGPHIKTYHETPYRSS